MHTTNYFNTFITVAPDCPIGKAEVPPIKGDKRSIANIQFDMISKHPYQFTSDEVIFRVYAEKNDLTAAELEEARVVFFSKGQACLRSSPLTKRYGWGVHSDEQGCVALYPMESVEYEKMQQDADLKVIPAMRSARKTMS